jgi:glycosyltransferase involved in cell wall biosynthesis
MKILFVLEHFYPYIGGAEKLFYVLTTHLAKQGYEVVVVTTQFDKNLPRTEIHKQVKIVRVNCYNRFGFTFLSLPKVLQNAKGCDVIHTTTYNAAIPAIISGKLKSKPVFVTFHEVWGNLWKRLPFTSFIERQVFYLFEKILLKLHFHKFIAVSEFTKAKLIENGIPENKIIQIHNGIDYQSFNRYQPNPPEIFTYTYFGRLGTSKGLDILIPAAAKFRESYPNSKLKIIIPKQPKRMYNKIMQMISAYQLDTYVEIHHNLTRNQLYNELLHSSCVVIPSYSEGFCFAAAETVALNIPIISSDLGALKEVVSGKFIKMKDQNPTALFNVLIEAYHGNWMTTPIKYFHLKDSIKMYTEIYSAMQK